MSNFCRLPIFGLMAGVLLLAAGATTYAATLDGLEITVEPNAKSFSLGEPVVIQVSYRNTGAEPVTIHPGQNRTCDLSVNIIDPDLHGGVNAPIGCGGAFTNIIDVIQPSQTLSFKYPLNDWWNFSLPGLHIINWKMKLGEKHTNSQSLAAIKHVKGLVSGEFTVILTPRNPRRLHALCRMASRLGGKTVFISYVNEDCAIPILVKNEDSFGLRHIASPQAIQALIKLSRESRQAEQDLAIVRGEYPMLIRFD